VDAFRIGVIPAATMGSKKRLLACLQLLFPVRFEGRDAGELDDLDGVLVLDGARLDELPRGVRTLVAASSSSRTGATAGPSATVKFTRGNHVARPLWGRTLIEKGIDGGAELALGATDHDEALATVDGRAVWWRGRNTEAQVSAFPVEELEEGETLREHLCAGRFMGFVPLLHLLRDVCGERGFSEAPLQASFVIDDPNLHWPSYGFLKYGELVEHARRHRYHVGLAMVPLDGWLVNGRAASLVRVNPGLLSVLVHGNDHVARELGRLTTDNEAELTVGQALGRVARFERRSGVLVRRAMAPPHGACSEAALRAMFRLGFDAACISRPSPWRDGLSAASPLVGWHPAELVAGGLPILPRHHLGGPREELVFRALLGQPLILYGHHSDFAQGLDVLALAADEINGLGDVIWAPLDEIAARNYKTRRDGDLLTVEVYSRRVLVDVPAGVTAVRVQTRELSGDPLWKQVTCDAGRAPMVKRRGGWVSEPLEIDSPGRIELLLPSDHPLQVDTVAERARKPWPITRRVLVESRDRLRPLLGVRATG
jgi:hypothetical protein